MTAPKRLKREAFLSIACTHAQKARIKQNAQKAGARTLTEYALTLLLKGDTEEFGFLRRKADGALVTADVYRQLRAISERLNAEPTLTNALLQETLQVVTDARRDIALSRVAQQVEISLQR